MASCDPLVWFVLPNWKCFLIVSKLTPKASSASESLDLLKAAYVRAGFKIKWRMISQDELKSFPSAWAKRLAYGRPRPCVELSGKLAQAATTIG